MISLGEQIVDDDPTAPMWLSAQLKEAFVEFFIAANCSERPAVRSSCHFQDIFESRVVAMLIHNLLPQSRKLWVDLE
jgi:hypothetical protein